MNDVNIINLLKGKTYTLGWDAVVAYDRQKINHLLQQQYVNKLGAGTHFPPITWENEDETICFENVTLGAPLISFEKANTENSRASATLEFIDGNVIEKNSNDQVINYIRIRPGMGLSMKLKIDLTAGEGSVDEKGKVLVNFSKGSITQIELNLTSELSAEVAKYFNSWLKNNEIIYEIGELSLKDLNAKLTPKKFIIRTQCAPDADLLHAPNYGDGAVLLFVATEYNPKGGSLPTNDYPWLIPEENSSAILINNKIVVEHYIKPSLDKILSSGEWDLIRGTGSTDAFYLQASDDATIKTSYIEESDEASNNPVSVWTGDYKQGWNLTRIYEDFVYSLKGSYLSLNESFLSLKFDKNNKFYRNIAGSVFECAETSCDEIGSRTNAVFKLKGEVIYDTIIDNKSVNFNFKENKAKIESNLEDDLDRGLYLVSQSLKEKITTILKNGVNILQDVSFQDIDVFAIEKVLFPEQNINQLESAYFPGDLVLFGNIISDLTSLTLSPLISTVAVGDEVTFATNTEEEVTYTLSPEEAGHITSDGVYSAPDSISGGTLNVTVTATTAEDVFASAHITVVPTPVLLSPSFIVVEEGKRDPIQFNAKVLGERGKLSWELTSSDPDVVGSIDKKGLYTPPDPDKSGEYPKGYTYVTVTATTSDGETSNACIMLVSRKTKPEFNILPSFVNLSPKVNQEFTAEETEDFSPNTWTQYPAELGKLSKPEEDDGVYLVNYTAPTKLSDDNVTIIQTMEKNKPNRAGYSVINLNNKEVEPWDLIDGVDILKVVNEAGGGSANLYKNGAQQAIIHVEFSGFHKSSSGSKSVPITLDDILPHLKLVDYVSGEPVDWESGEDWYYSIKKNQFQRLPVGDFTDDQDNSIQRAASFTFYVSCSQNSQSSSKRIAVQVTLRDGTVVSTAENGSSGFNSSVTLRTIAAIDYSLVENITVKSNLANVIDDSVSWASHKQNTKEFVEREDKCKIKATDFFISPADGNIEKFHSFSIQQNKIINLDVSNIYYTWDNKTEPVFNCLNDESGKQCAVLGKKEKTEIDGTCNMWFFGGHAELDEGQIYFSTKEKDIFYRIAMEEVDYGKTRESLPYFTLLKVSTPIEELKPYQWKSVIHPLTLSLTDIYGNTGELSVSWDEEEYYDRPNVF